MRITIDGKYYHRPVNLPVRFRDKLKNPSGIIGVVVIVLGLIGWLLVRF